MAYTHPSLSRLSAHANSNFPTLWGYSTADTKATVNTAGYFDGASADLKVNDMILVVSGVGGTVVHSWHVVLSNAAGVVDVSDGVDVDVTDSD